MSSEAIHAHSKQEQDQMQQQNQQQVERLKYSNRAALRSIVGRDDGGIGLVGQRVVVGGWVKSCKEEAKKVVAVTDVMCPEVLLSRFPILRSIARLLAKGSSPPAEQPQITQPRTLPFIAYLRINDGSCIANLQVVVDSSIYPLGQITHIGTSILVEGIIEKVSAATKYATQLKAEKIIYAGSIDLEKYPLGRARLSLDFVRDYPYLRPRTSTIAAVTRIRNGLSHATQLFFQSNGFLHVHMPIITTTSSGADNRAFQVTTLLSKHDDGTGKINDKEDVNLEVVMTAIKEKSARIEELKRSDSNKEVLIGALRDLQKANELAQQLGKQQNKAISVKARKLDFSKDFFSCRAYLSTSSELHLESYACALSSVYSFGPTFQAFEDIDDAMKLAETWMIEVALAFAEAEDAMNCAEDCLKFLCQTILDNYPLELKLISKRIDENCMDRLKAMGSSPFARTTYTEAVEILKKAQNKKSETQVEWGSSLSKEHERYLADEVFKKPIIIYEYPKEVKPFYIRTSDDGRTVSAFDIIAPKVGKLGQGNQKEERIQKISARLHETGLFREEYEWYLDLRRHGTVRHSGFNIRFEDLIMFATGINDVRDVIPFPRAKGYAID